MAARVEFRSPVNTGPVLDFKRRQGNLYVCDEEEGGGVGGGRGRRGMEWARQQPVPSKTARTNPTLREKYSVWNNSTGTCFLLASLYERTTRRDGYADTTRDVSYADTTHDVSYADTTRDVSYADTTRDVSYVDTKRDVSYADTMRDVTYVNTTRDVSYADTKCDCKLCRQHAWR